MLGHEQMPLGRTLWSLWKMFDLSQSTVEPGVNQSRNSLRREIGCVLIIQQNFRKFEFFHCAQFADLTGQLFSESLI